MILINTLKENIIQSEHGQNILITKIHYKIK